MIEILRRGMIAENSYVIQCLSCHALFRFTRQEACRGDSYDQDDFIYIKCPECHAICWCRE